MAKAGIAGGQVQAALSPESKLQGDIVQSARMRTPKIRSRLRPLNFEGQTGPQRWQAGYVRNLWRRSSPMGPDGARWGRFGARDMDARGPRTQARMQDGRGHAANDVHKRFCCPVHCGRNSRRGSRAPPCATPPRSRKVEAMQSRLFLVTLGLLARWSPSVTVSRVCSTAGAAAG
eukprot:2696343-Rhodomonas_salina.1